ncbi:MAG: FGGY-family carbohydrate kinase [Pseudomonadota bacterium]
MSLTLGIDIGTGGIRGAVLDDSGAVMTSARVDHLPNDPDKIDADTWWVGVQNCIRLLGRNLLEAGLRTQDVARIAVDGTSGSMVLVDDALRPVTRALMYNSSGFEAEAARIAECAPPSHITRGSNSALARAMRLVAEDPDGNARHLLHQADFVTARLIGRGGFSDHNNTLKTGFDPATETWPEWMAILIEMDLMPDARPVGEPLDVVAPGVAAELGLSPATVVHAGTTDSIAAFFACAPQETGVAVTSLGSTLAIKVLSPTRVDDPEMGLYSHRINQNWLAGGASNTGGAVLAAHFDKDALLSLSARIDPQQESPLEYYPLLTAGERFPVNDPHLQPQLEPRPDDDVAFLHGMLESMARIEARCYRAVEAAGGPYPQKLFTAGGGAANPTWTAIRSRVLAIAPKTSQQTEAAVGVARLALAHAVED